MKLLIASDIHGDISSAKKIIEIFNEGKFDKILLLGDILYHGPRNDLPSEYAPKEVIPLLNSYASYITSVRGNCDAEVDGMVLDFSVSGDYEILCASGVKIFATHGHVYSEDKLPQNEEFDLFIQGHTHLPDIKQLECNATFLNPGSITLPKGGNPRSYATLEDGVISIFDIDGNILKTKRIS